MKKEFREESERFTLEESRQPGYWIATDHWNGIELTFREHHLNDDQEVNLLGGNTFASTEEAMAIPQALQELGFWLHKNHFELCQIDLHALRGKMGERIQSLRVARGLTREDLAERTGMSPKRIREMEDGTFPMRLDILNRVAHGLDLRLDFVANDSEPYMPPRE